MRGHIMSDAVRVRYRRGDEDESLLPLVRFDRQENQIGGVKPSEPVFFYDLRGEREVELSRALAEPGFKQFKTKGPVQLATMIEYSNRLKARVAFPAQEKIENTLCQVLSRAGIRQLKVCESEKAIHLGYFLNGKSEHGFKGEERVIIESRRVQDYGKVPEMRAKQVADALLSKLKDRSYRLFAVNFANVDVVGHLENETAILAAVECVDEQIGRVAEEALRLGITSIITADHGTVEKWLYPDGVIDTGHTDSPVPVILVDDRLSSEGITLRQGELTDLAPTILKLLGLKIPSEMTGKSLIRQTRAQAEQVLLIIADGWGHREEKYGNLIKKARTPNFDRLWQKYPHAKLKASGLAVGMPRGTVGNSEAGHLHIGAGRKIYSDRVRIDRAIQDQTFFSNPVLIQTFRQAKNKKTPLHLLGIVSFYSSHGSLNHLYALLKLAKKLAVPKVYLHCLLGRRGERPESGAHYIREVENFCSKTGTGKVATVMGRFWALDREENWDRVEKAYKAFVFGDGIQVYE